MNDTTRKQKEKLAALLVEKGRRVARKKHEAPSGLIEFIKYFWDVLEPNTPFVDGHAIRAICMHLEAVTDGKINRLLINVPPGFAKSLITNVFWPAWEYGPRNRPHERYVAFSYAAHLTERDNARFRDLIKSRRYQMLYGHVFKLTEDAKIKIANDKTGWKFASSVGGISTGERGTRVLGDDLHNVKEAESKIVRQETVRWFRESASNRLNDVVRDAIVLIGQRVHDEDVSGSILADGLPYCHLCIPMEFDTNRESVPTDIGWVDWRTEQGQLAWPERYPAVALHEFKMQPIMWAGQYQQSPEERGGGIFKREWWEPFELPLGASMPVRFAFKIASCDTAYTRKEKNDPSAMVVLGVFHDKDGHPKVMLLGAWEKWLHLSGKVVEKLPNESERSYLRRAQPEWGLVEWIMHTCRRFKVDRLLIEAKASGHSADQELRKLVGAHEWAFQLVPSRGDKEARAEAVSYLFSEGLVYAPAEIVGENFQFRDWASLVINQAAVFPRGRDDLVDALTQALKWLRDNGMLQRKVERDSDDYADSLYRSPHENEPLYPG